MLIPVFRPTVRRVDMEAVLYQLVEDALAPGEVSEAFADGLADFCGASQGVVLRDLERAISLVCDSLGLVSGDKVAVMPLLSSVYGNVFVSRGIDVVFVDVVPSSGFPVSFDGLDGVKAVFWGIPLGVVPDMSFFSSLGVPLVMDLSQGLGALWNGESVGGFADFVVVSLEESGIITSAGGAFAGVVSRKFVSGFKGAVASLPSFYFLSDMNAALGKTQLAQFDFFISKRREIFDFFTSALMQSRHSGFGPGADGGTDVPFSFPVVLSSSIKDVMVYAKKQGVEVMRIFGDSLWSGFESDVFCKGAELLVSSCIVFPLYPLLSHESVELISRVIATLP
ncbi:DegT/DnrJ/EryC1/StrS family aminotransferase [Spirochaetia bacterium 38H-sp]|uniref:DegT/DnrJ/EryC1/StrS family aminotransferase n=1 Tax=Rarispira pelagica TaxID=3141764 RepID=A0ABU9UDD9_9SPIR